MDDDMIYYAKSPNPQGYQQTVKEHLQAVAELAQKFGTPMGLATAAGSLLSVIICVIAFLVLRRHGRLVPEEG